MSPARELAHNVVIPASCQWTGMSGDELVGLLAAPTIFGSKGYKLANYIATSLLVGFPNQLPSPVRGEAPWRTQEKC